MIRTNDLRGPGARVPGLLASATLLLLPAAAQAQSLFDGGTYPTSGGSKHIVAGDVDDDGDEDLIVLQWTTLFVVDNQGGAQGGTEGAFAVDSTINLGGGGLFSELEDWDADGDLDVLVHGQPADARGKIFLNQGGAQGGAAGTFLLGPTFLHNAQGGSAHFLDADGDGDLDVFATARVSGTAVWLNDGAGGLVPGWTSTANPATDASSVKGDVDGDGDLDVVSETGTYGSSFVVWFNNGDGTFTDVLHSFPGVAWNEFWTKLDLGDLDGDGDLDLAGGFGLYMNSGGGTFVQGAPLDAANQFGRHFFDLDSDGDLDLMTPGRLFVNQGGLQGGVEGDLVRETPDAPYDSSFFDSADIDGDGDLDIVGARYRKLILNGAPQAVADADGDGVDDDLDNCPAVPNPGQENLDGDAAGDACDSDADGDLDPGATDCDDLDPSRYAGADEVCNDGIDNDCDTLIDTDDDAADCDADGVDNGSDNCPDDFNPGQADLDGDEVGDACDWDADGDGDDAATDCDDLDPSRYSGADEVCNDGIDNDCDTLIDTDDDAADCDADGVDNGSDNCPDDFNPGQADLDGDAVGDACDWDDDGDGVDDLMDNCPVVSNADQSDFDADGAGDACDDDGDGDGVDDFGGDLCHFTAPSDADAGVPSQSLGKNRWADVDGDGVFDTKGNPSGRYFDMTSTSGCSCAQIIDLCGLGNGHSKFGCSNGAMDNASDGGADLCEED